MTDELIVRMAKRGFPNVTPGIHTVFENLDPQGTRISDLATRADVTRQSMGELITLLERRGWVTRTPDPQDGRAQRVLLTAEGKRAVRTALSVIREIEAEWQERWRTARASGDLLTMLQAGLNITSEPK